MGSLKAHLIGICGAGMSAVAHLLQEQGYEVSGSDEGFYPPVSEYLEKLDLACATGYRATNIPEDVSLIVIGKNARLVPQNNEEVFAALENHQDKVKSFPEVLADLTAARRRIVVAGSYGKSTLTSMVAWCLVHAKKDPGYFIGAIPANLDTSSALGTGPEFVFEGDEYPSANWDERSKFLHYDPQVVVLTSACHDHVNIYPTLAAYHKPFRTLLAGLEQQQGELIACVAEENAKSFYRDYSGAKTSYGFTEDADWWASDIRLGEVTSFTINHAGRVLGVVQTSLLGRHNVENMLGAAACLVGQGIVSFEVFQTAMACFDGIARRLDRKKINSELIVYEGFGSSYEKARAAIAAIVAHFPGKRVTVLFEPHTFTWRNRAALSQYESAFDDVARVWLYQPPSQGSATHDQLTLAEIKAKAAAYHPDIRTFDQQTYKSIIEAVDPASEVMLVLSSGSFDGLLVKILQQAEMRRPTR